MLSKVISTGAGVEVRVGRSVLVGIGVRVRVDVRVGGVTTAGLADSMSNAPRMQAPATSNKIPRIHAPAELFFRGG